MSHAVEGFFLVGLGDNASGVCSRNGQIQQLVFNCRIRLLSFLEVPS